MRYTQTLCIDILVQSSQPCSFEKLCTRPNYEDYYVLGDVNVHFHRWSYKLMTLHEMKVYPSLSVNKHNINRKR